MKYKVKSYDRNLNVSKGKVQYTSRPHKYTDVKLFPLTENLEREKLDDKVQTMTQKLEQLENELSVIKLNEKFKQIKQNEKKHKPKELSYQPIDYDVSIKHQEKLKQKKRKKKRELKRNILTENYLFLSVISSVCALSLMTSYYLILLIARNQLF